VRVFIGYDAREDDAYRVCAASLLRHASVPVEIIKLDIKRLQNIGLYRRPYRTEETQMVDLVDGRPFSTEFAFSRFFVPSLSDGWAIFCDCDFLFTQDIAQLVPLLSEKYAVMVVKHDHRPTESVKMDGVSQAPYPRKNWSSFVAWNCDHPSNRLLDTHEVNTQTGKWLHGFSWLRDDEIGELPQTWNWLSGVTPDLGEVPKAIHYTLGIPRMTGHENTPYADLWRDELERTALKEKPNKPVRHFGSQTYAQRKALHG